MKTTATKVITINRAPVLTRWATVVAQRLGFAADEALSLGRAVAGLNAQSKGRRLGIFKPDEETAKKAREKEREEMFFIEVCGRTVPARNTDEGVRAVVKGKQVIKPDSVRRYLKGKFGEELPAVRKAMTKLARAYPPKELATKAYQLYEQFRPDIPEGQKGWGAEGVLSLERIEALAKRPVPARGKHRASSFPAL
jgi:hypothetical protein